MTDPACEACSGECASCGRDLCPAGWQPIETAPRDGTPILIWDPTKEEICELAGFKFDCPRYAIGYYRVWNNGGEWMWGNRNSACVSPQFWQPLPAPPDTKGE